MAAVPVHSEAPGMLLARYLAQAGVASRRASVELIRQGLVSVDGRVVAEPATRIDPDLAQVHCQGRLLRLGQEFRYYLLHKPVGYTCSHRDAHAGKLAIDLLPRLPGERLFSIGRLDRDSEGLLLFTNDGELAHRLTHPRYEVPKVYEVWVAVPLPESAPARLLDGVEFEGEWLRAKEVRWLGPRHLRITVTEGKKHEIRRMCRCLGTHVRRLLRTHFGPLALGNFEAGKVRELSAREVELLQTGVAAKAGDAPTPRRTAK